jgi:hypothetical protein
LSVKIGLRFTSSVGVSCGIRNSVSSACQAKSKEVFEATKTLANRLRSVAKIGLRAKKDVSRQPKNKRDIQPMLQLSARNCANALLNAAVASTT